MAIELEAAFADFAAGSALAGAEKLVGLDGSTAKSWLLSQIATYVGAIVTTGLFDLKGSTNCSANPNYPAASKGDTYIVSGAGKIGGESGKSVDVGDIFFASADNAGGTEASVGASWSVVEHNLAGALLAANNLSDVASVSTARANLGLAIGVDVQAFSAALALYAGISPSANIQTLLGSATYAAARTNLGAMGFAGYASGGFYLPDGITAPVTGAGSANTIYFHPFILLGDARIESLVTRVTTAAASGNFQMALYAADAATKLPTGAALYSSASQSTGTNATIEDTGPSLALTGGLYWVGTNKDTTGAAAAFICTSAVGFRTGQRAPAQSAAGLFTGNGSMFAGYSKTQTFGTWPTLTGSFSGDSLTTVFSNVIPAIGFKAG